MDRVFLGSLSRATDLQGGNFRIDPVPRAAWRFADYVVGEVIQASGPYSRVELSTGRLVDLVVGDRVMGAFGTRAATLETCGDWSLIGDDLIFDHMTPAGLFGKETSRNYMIPALPVYRYLGHVWRDGKTLGMADFVRPSKPQDLEIPTILIVGTSMSAGKTTTARVLIRLLKEMGLKVAGAKLTGAGRFRDILTMQDAGADQIFDFVDAGLPSTVCPSSLYRDVITSLLSRIAKTEADVLVAEVGASPLEPYNGEAAVELVAGQVRMSVLCATDPYAVKGVLEAFELQPSLISGPCTTTEAGIALIDKLTGLPSVNILAPDSQIKLRTLLESRLNLNRSPLSTAKP